MQNKNGLLLITKRSGTNYSGFDGKEIWPDLNPQEIPLENGLVPINYLDDVLKYKQTVKGEVLLLYIQRDDLTPPLPNDFKDNFRFLGFDYGNYISEYNYYSLVFHEVISGSRDEFKQYIQYLNEYLLFPSLEMIPDLEKTKNDLRLTGEHLEDEQPGEEFQPISIHLYKRL